MPFWSWTRTTQEEDEDSDDAESYATFEDDAPEDDDRINENYDGDDDDEEEEEIVDDDHIHDEAVPHRFVNANKEMNDSSDEIMEPQEFASLLQMPTADLSMEREMGVTSITILDEKIRRERIPSAMSDDIVDNDAREHTLAKEEEEELEDVPMTRPVSVASEGGDDDDDAPQNLQDLFSLFLLAIEADRVDILQELLQSTTNTDPGMKELLINPVVALPSDAVHASDAAAESNYCCTSIPPLHMAISYGSMNAINYLLRVGANPALRPDAELMKQLAEAQKGKEPKDNSSVYMLDVPHIQKYDQLTAWEVAFGRDSASNTATPELQKKSSWLFGNGSSSKSSSTLPPSKRESIRHAFLAEAIRCISNDDVERLRQLLDAGMPPGDATDPSSSLWKWCTDFHATQCLSYLQPLLNPSSSKAEAATPNDNDTASTPTQTSARKLFLESSGGSSLVALQNRHDELDALCRSLSLCLDNVAEEVSVGAGLLLQSTGAQALASHVRTVKHQKQQLLDEYERYQDAYQNSLDELIYYIRQYQNQTGMRRPPIEDAQDIHEWWSKHMSKTDVPSKIVPQSSATTPSVPANDDARPLEDEDEQKHRQQIITQIMMCENKIRLLRAAMADLSDENVRNLEEIERRGLMGGIDYIRTLREEMREVEFSIHELKQLDVDCRTKIRTLQIQMNTSVSSLASNGSSVPKPVASFDPLSAKNGSETTISDTVRQPTDDAVPSTKVEAPVSTNGDEVLVNSERIQQGHSSALVVHGPTRGFLSLNLWQILLRIIGISNQRNVPAASGVTSKGQSISKSDSQSNGGGSTSARSVIII